MIYPAPPLGQCPVHRRELLEFCQAAFAARPHHFPRPDTFVRFCYTHLAGNFADLPLTETEYLSAIYEVLFDDGLVKEFDPEQRDDPTDAPEMFFYKVFREKLTRLLRPRRRRRLVALPTDIQARGGPPDVAEAVLALTPRQQAVVRMRFWEGMTFEEIAASLGVCLRTAKVDWKAAKDLLRTKIGYENRKNE